MFNKKTFLSLVAVSTLLLTSSAVAEVAGQGEVPATIAVVKPVSSQTDEGIFFGIVRGGFSYTLDGNAITTESTGKTAQTVLLNGTNGRVSVKVNDATDNSDNYAITGVYDKADAGKGINVTKITCNNGVGALVECTDVQLAKDLKELQIKFGGDVTVGDDAISGMQSAGKVKWTIKHIAA